MSVIHILKDGSRVEDITGHIVKVSDAEPIYRLMADINSKKDTYIGKALKNE